MSLFCVPPAAAAGEPDRSTDQGKMDVALLSLAVASPPLAFGGRRGVLLGVGPHYIRWREDTWPLHRPACVGGWCHGIPRGLFSLGPMRADPLPELWGKDDEDASVLEKVFHLDLPLVRTNAVAGRDLQRCMGLERLSTMTGHSH